MDENKETSLEGAETGTEGTQGKTFTQEDVNRIVQERLAKERNKQSISEELDKRSAELERRELHMTAKEILSEKGLPVQLFEALNCTNEETIKKSVSIIEAVFNDYKSNCKANFKLVGFQPAVSGIIPNVEAVTEDIELREIMGLP